MQYLCKSWVQPATHHHPLLKTINIKPEPSSVNSRTHNRNSFRDFNEIKIEDDEDNSGVGKFPLPSHVKSITSTSNPFVKHCLKLRQSSSYRHCHGSVLVVGTTPIRSILLFLLPYLFNYYNFSKLVSL